MGFDDRGSGFPLRSPPQTYNRRDFTRSHMHPDSVALLRKLSVFTLFAFALFLAYSLLRVIAIIAFAAFLTALFSPAVATFEKWKIPDFVAVILIYFAIFVLAASVFATTLPIFATQIVALFATISSFADRLSADFAA